MNIPATPRETFYKFVILFVIATLVVISSSIEDITITTNNYTIITYGITTLAIAIFAFLKFSFLKNSPWICAIAFVGSIYLLQPVVGLPYLIINKYFGDSSTTMHKVSILGKSSNRRNKYIQVKYNSKEESISIDSDYYEEIDKCQEAELYISQGYFGVEHVREIKLCYPNK